MALIFPQSGEREGGCLRSKTSEQHPKLFVKERFFPESGTFVLGVHRNLPKIIDDVQSVVPAIDHSRTQTCDKRIYVASIPNHLKLLEYSV